MHPQAPTDPPRRRRRMASNSAHLGIMLLDDMLLCIACQPAQSTLFNLYKPTLTFDTANSIGRGELHEQDATRIARLLKAVGNPDSETCGGVEFDQHRSVPAYPAPQPCLIFIYIQLSPVPAHPQSHTRHTQDPIHTNLLVSLSVFLVQKVYKSRSNRIHTSL